MRKLITIICILFCLQSSAQVYQLMPQYGYQAPRMAFDSTLQIPTFCGVPTLKSVQFVTKKAAIAFDSCNNRFYQYNPSTLAWSVVSGGGGSTDTTSLSNRINLKLNISDTAAMLNPYLKKIDTATLSNRINLKIDSVKRRRDSVFAYRNGTEVFQFKDSIGGTTIDTTSLSNRINGKIDSLKRRTDSVFAYRNGNQIFQYKDSVGTNPPPNGYYGAFQDNTTQTALDVSVATAVKFNTTDLSNGVTIVNDGSGNPTRVTIANAGVYNIQFSLQLEKISGSGNYVIDIWLRKNGTNVEGTTGKIVLTGSANASPVVAAWNYVLQLASNDYVQIMWSTSNTNAVIISESASTPYPSVPSSILTITQQSGIMAGTGISPLDTANMLSPYQRKFLPANSVMANNTASAANASATTFKQFGNQTYSDSITITGASNPSGAINHSFRWSQVGNLVTLHITLIYATNGSLSQVSMELPDGLPLPVLPTGLTANNDIICYGTGFMVSTTTGVSSVFSKVFLRQNTGLTNDYEIVINQATNSSYRIMNATIQYFAQ